MFDNLPGGDVEIIGRAMTKEERIRRQAAGAAELAAHPSWDNPNYIPIEDLVSQDWRELLKEEPFEEWDDFYNDCDDD